MVLAGFVCATTLQGGLTSPLVDQEPRPSPQAPGVVDGGLRQALSFPTALQGDSCLCLLQTAPSAQPLSLGVVDTGRFCTIAQLQEGNHFSNCRLSP